LKWPGHFAPYIGDIIAVEYVKEDLDCFTLIVKEKVFQCEIWDGANFVETDFDGNVSKKLAVLGIRDGYLVTVDYHS